MKEQKEPSSVSLPKGRLGKVWSGARVKPLKELFWFLGTWLFPVKRLELSVPVLMPPGSMMTDLCPLVQHCLISFLLTSSHCVVTFCRLRPPPPPQTTYNMLYFLIHLSGIRLSLHMTSQCQLLSSLSFHLLGLPLRTTEE